MFTKAQARTVGICASIISIFIVTGASNSDSWVVRALSVSLFILLLAIMAFTFANVEEPSKDENAQG